MVDSLSFLDVLLSPSGLIVLVMAAVCAAMLALFLPGGFRKVISVIAVFLTAGLAIFYLKHQKNRLIGDYNLHVDKYLDVLAEKQRMDAEAARLRREVDALESRPGVAQEERDALMAQYEGALKQANKKGRLRAELSSEIERHADKLDSGYELGNTAAFRDRWEEIKNTTAVEAVPEEPAAPPAPPAPPTAAVPVVAPVVDTEPEPPQAAAIDIRFEGFRLKGDIT